MIIVIHSFFSEITQPALHHAFVNRPTRGYSLPNREDAIHIYTAQSATRLFFSSNRQDMLSYTVALRSYFLVSGLPFVLSRYLFRNSVKMSKNLSLVATAGFEPA